MATQGLAPEEYTYTQEEGLRLFAQGVRGNKECKEQRKVFNLCRSTPLGKFVEPEFCKDKASDFINCFLRVQRNQSKLCSERLDAVVKCGLNGGNCDTQLGDYLNCQ